MSCSDDDVEGGGAVTTTGGRSVSVGVWANAATLHPVTAAMRAPRRTPARHRAVAIALLYEFGDVRNTASPAACRVEFAPMAKTSTTRFTVSLPDELMTTLDRLRSERGYGN